MDYKIFDTVEEQQKFEKVMEELEPDLKRISDELDECLHISEKDLSIVINTR